MQCFIHKQTSLRVHGGYVIHKACVRHPLSVVYPVSTIVPKYDVYKILHTLWLCCTSFEWQQFDNWCIQIKQMAKESCKFALFHVSNHGCPWWLEVSASMRSPLNILQTSYLIQCLHFAMCGNIPGCQGRHLHILEKECKVAIFPS